MHRMSQAPGLPLHEHDLSDMHICACAASRLPMSTYVQKDPTEVLDCCRDPADWQVVLTSSVSLCLQITGFSDADTATMNIFFNVGNAVGMLTGGVLGDLFAKRSPRYARPFVNQLSMIIIAPLFFILYKALPGELQLRMANRLAANHKA